MGTEFGGECGSGMLTTRLGLEYEHPAYLGLNMGNAHALLSLLGLARLRENDTQYGSCTMPEARRAILQARARFERTAHEHTREGSDTKRPGGARFVTKGLDEDGLKLRLDMFEEFVNTMDRMGADRIRWS